MCLQVGPFEGRSIQPTASLQGNRDDSLKALPSLAQEEKLEWREPQGKQWTIRRGGVLWCNDIETLDREIWTHSDSMTSRFEKIAVDKQKGQREVLGLK